MIVICWFSSSDSFSLSWVETDDCKLLKAFVPSGVLEGKATHMTCRGGDSSVVRAPGRIFFSRIDFLCRLLFWYPFYPHVTTVARKISRSFCRKCRWQVTAKHAYTLCMWLCMKWHGTWLYGVLRTCTEMAAVSCGTSHACAVSTPLQWIFKKMRCIKS